MEPQIRVLTDFAELSRSQRVFAASMVGFAVSDDPGPVDDDFEPGRTFGAFVDGELVATVTSFASELVVPGGARVRHAAVSDVGVLPTHTRRGLATALLEQQLRDVAERGEIIASLRASQAVIYERFGYGVASAAAMLELEVAGARVRASVSAGGPVRFVDPVTSFDLMEKIYEGVDRPGIMRRPGHWWRHQARNAARPDNGIWYTAVHGAPGAEDGYVRYRPRDTATWFSNSNRTIAVTDLVATGPQAMAGLLRFLLSVDLVHRIVLSTQPLDHGIEKMLVDERAVRTVSLEDETWLRLIDVEAALAARSYRGSGLVTIGVRDEQLTGNTGVYQVNGPSAGAGPGTGAASGDGGAGGDNGAARAASAASAASAAGAASAGLGEVRRVSEVEPQLSLDVAALGALYLGGTKWWQLARAGRVLEHVPGALAVAEHLFATDRPPYAGTMF